MKVLGLVPARGGSKGLPGKNIRPLHGHPLIAWSIAAGLACPRVDAVLCSTDAPDIAEVAQAYGADVPFLRPAEFAQDLSTDLEVFRHALGWLEAERGWRPDLVVQLRPTTPLRRPGWIDESIAILEADPSIDSVRSVVPAPHTPFKMWRTGGDGLLQPLLEVPGIPEPYNEPRQRLPEALWHTGQLDVIRTNVIMSGNGSMTGRRIAPLRAEADLAHDIDRLEDFEMCEIVLPRVRDRLAIPAPVAPSAVRRAGA